MGRYRAVHCLIWNDDKFPFLPEGEQLIWLHAYTYQHSTALGIYCSSIEALAGNKRTDVETYRKRFLNLCERGLIRYDERFQIVWFPKFLKWNKPDNPNVLKNWLKVLGEIPDCDTKSEFIFKLCEFAKGWGEPYLKVCPDVPEAFRQTSAKPIQKQDQDQDQKQDMSTSYSCSELSETDTTALDELEYKPEEVSPEITRIPLINRDGEFIVRQSDIDQWADTFPGVDVVAALKRYRQWNVDNPKKRKTMSGIRKHITGWLGREQDMGSVRSTPPGTAPVLQNNQLKATTVAQAVTLQNAQLARNLLEVRRRRRSGTNG
ncbi:MAG: hypothetical protein OEV64_00720 [Desulfobulbaceae bacterium]|nr:hypothetical protein [Desulfobulbaceae bacterium]